VAVKDGPGLVPGPAPVVRCLREQTYRQLFIEDLGHEEPTILGTNDRDVSARNLVTRYARRMLIENAAAGRCAGRRRT
jgi:hypothetical protein